MLMLAAAAGTVAALRFHAALDGGSSEPTLPVKERSVTYELGCAKIRNGGELAYAAAGAVSFDQGTVSFWWKPGQGAGEALSISYAERLDRFLVIGSRMDNAAAGGPRIGFALRDRDRTDWVEIAHHAEAPVAGRWRHVAVTWTELSGAALYVDGRRHVRVPGPVYFNASPGLLTLHGNGEFDELRVYSGALDESHLAALARRQEPVRLPPLSPPPPLAGRFGWHAVANVPSVDRGLRVTRLEVTEARAVRRAVWWLSDGREETVWPLEGPEGRYRDEAQDFRLIVPEGETFNVVRSAGNARAVFAPDESERSPRPPDARQLHYWRFRHARRLEELGIEVLSGTLSAVDIFRVEELPPDAEQVGKVAMPMPEDGAIRGARVEVAGASPGAYYRVAVRDPVTARTALEFDVRAGSPRFLLDLRFPPYLVRAGAAMTVEIWSSVPDRESVRPERVAWLGGTAPDAMAAARRVHLNRRRQEMRDLYRDWTARGERPGAAPALAADVLHWQANDRLARLLSEGRLLSGTTAAGSWDQLQRAGVSHLREVVDWWIDHRQIDTGEFGLGPEADARLVEDMAVLARLDGRVERYKRSARKLLDWMLREKWGSASLPRVAAAALMLDPGNPALARLARRMDPVAPAAPSSSPVPAFGLETEDEPAVVNAEAGDLRKERLGMDGAVSWENTGGALAARVLESTNERLRVQAMVSGGVGRRVLLRVWRLVHGEYELRLTSEPSPRKVFLKRGRGVELDLPSAPVGSQPVELTLELLRRDRPVEELPDPAIEISGLSGDGAGAIVVAVTNLGAVPTGEVRVRMHPGDDQDRTAGLGSIRDIAPGATADVRVAYLVPEPGMIVRIYINGDDAFDGNNELVLDAPAAQRLTRELLAR